MSDSLDQLQELLHQNGYSLTAARRTVFETMQQSGPQSMREIVMACLPKIDRASVYRTITLFENLSVVTRLQVGWKYKLELSDKFTAHHHHLTCLGCGKITDIEDEKHIDEFIRQVSAEFGFSPQHHQFEIAGYCQKCRAKKQ